MCIWLEFICVHHEKLFNMTKCFAPFYINSPLDQFEVFPLLSLDMPILGNFSISLTNFGLYSVLVLLLVIGLHLVSINQIRIVPNRFSIGLEALYGSLHHLVKEQIGTKNEIFFPFIYGLFLFVLFSNLISNVPYNFCISASAIYALGLSFTIWFGVTGLSLYIYGIKFFSKFIPGGSPFAMAPLLSLIELISYTARAFSLGIRLFANLLSGHSLLQILSSFLYPLTTKGIGLFAVSLIPLTFFTALVGLEIGVAFIQAFVFTLLTASYIKEALELH